MPKPYSQSKALWAITRASFKAIFAQPTAIVFSLLFPIIFILIFGAFGNGGGVSYRIAFEKDSDTSNTFYVYLENNHGINIIDYADTATLNNELEKGRLTAVLNLKQVTDSLQHTRIVVSIRSTSASGNTLGSFMQMLDYSKLKYELSLIPNKQELVHIEQPVISQGKKYRQIDFILPGQLGFSILFSTLFGIAFTFYTLREQLVLKRFYASPVNRIHILMGIGASRLFFQLMNVVILTLFGHLFLNFTLQHGAVTFFEMVILSIIMLFLLMGVGLIFSSVAKNDSSIPLLINLFGFPQMLLSGTFFPITVFPEWLQTICKILPLTQYNDAIRKISFEGLHLYDTWKEIGSLGIWIVVIYVVLARVIKWE
ncbi:MAG: ABC transporter permease [Bacteroidia bacterium]|nr:ABC transporter permease [Bacteroidia bacterium]